MDVCRALGIMTFQSELPTPQGIPCRTSLLLQSQTMVSDPSGHAELAARAAWQEELLGVTAFNKGTRNLS